MTDFHTHILPGIDDGAKDAEMALAMLQMEAEQGIDTVVLTPHFYADRESPEQFLKRREAAFQSLNELMPETDGPFPQLRLGAEVYCFPNMSQCEALCDLRIQGTDCILLEPPFTPWSDYLLLEMEQTGDFLGLTPVVAHVDRYMRMFGDRHLIDRVLDRGMLVQFNTRAFTDPKFRKMAEKCLKKDKVAFFGSDCHNIDTRAPNWDEVEIRA